MLLCSVGGVASLIENEHFERSRAV